MTFEMIEIVNKVLLLNGTQQNLTEFIDPIETSHWVTRFKQKLVNQFNKGACTRVHLWDPRSKIRKQTPMCDTSDTLTHAA